MSEQMKSAIVAAIVAGLFGIASVLINHWLISQQQVQIETLNTEVFRTRVSIDSPFKGMRSDRILPTVTGTVGGTIPAGHKVLVGHRELSEQTVKMHADRYAEILSDGTFMVEDIYLGSESQGKGKKYEIIALVMSDESLNTLQLKDGDNPLQAIPDHVAKAVTIVERK